MYQWSETATGGFLKEGESICFVSLELKKIYISIFNLKKVI
jgi:hypothetical protein